jgi:hypothetical protein
MSKHIVGRRVEVYQTAQGIYGQPWIVTRHTVATEMHATKGWRTVSHQRSVSMVAKLPSVADWRKAASTTFERTKPARDRGVLNMSHTYDLMRNPWQRRNNGAEARRLEEVQ